MKYSAGPPSRNEILIQTKMYIHYIFISLYSDIVGSSQRISAIAPMDMGSASPAQLILSWTSLL